MESNDGRCCLGVPLLPLDLSMPPQHAPASPTPPLHDSPWHLAYLYLSFSQHALKPCYRGVGSTTRCGLSQHAVLT
eukprot:1160693-Pelagomonas_calceolata.AAC.1